MVAVHRLTDAWISKDPVEMSRWLSDDITEIGPAFSGALMGKVNFLRKYEAYFSGPLEIVFYRIVVPRTIFLSARLAVVYFSYHMRTRAEKQVERSRGKESMLLEKTRGRWTVRFIHWHQDPD
jgi:hypothetical protein